jgi:hypothetical protein
MSTLSDEGVVEIVKRIAMANKVSVASVLTEPVIDSTGSEAIEIKIVLTPGSFPSIMGEPAAQTVADVVRELADIGEERFPIVRYEEQGVPS